MRHNYSCRRTGTAMALLLTAMAAAGTTARAQDERPDAVPEREEASRAGKNDKRATGEYARLTRPAL